MTEPSYDAEMREKAEAEGLVLATLSLCGKYAKRGGVTVQLYIRTDAQRKAIDELIRRLLVGDLKGPKS